MTDGVISRTEVGGSYSRPLADHRPNWPLLVLISVIPLQNIYLGKLPTFGAGINFINVMLLFSLLTWKLRKDLSSTMPTALGKPILAYSLIYLFSYFYAVNTLGQLNDASLLSMLKDTLIGMLFYFLVLNSVRDRRGLIYALGATMLPLPYMFWVFYSQLSSVYRFNYDDDLRLVSGTFMLLGSNEIAAFYATYTLVLIAFIFCVKNFRARALVSGLAILNMYCAVYSFSRGAYLALLVGLTVLAWHVNKKVAVLVIAFTVISGGALLNFFPESVQERFNSIFVQEDDRDASAQSRFELWDTAMEIYGQSPIVGVGFRSFARLNPTGQDTHNYFVKVLTEQGAIGFLILLLIFWRATKISRRLYIVAEDPLLKGLGAGMVACIAAVAATNMFGDRFTHYPLIAYFWVYLGLVESGLNISKSQRMQLDTTNP
ncbi:MAG: O-antigen ligase family protein [Gammaproteobacteria bacterium]|nr:O-antigen ligase family protein [Gammaproteobacteria bacterium]